MIDVNDCFLTHQVMFPLFHTLHQCIHFLIICRIVNNCTIKSFRMKTDGVTMLHQDCSHGIVTCISLYLKLLFQIWKYKHWCCTDSLFQCIKGFLFLASPFKSKFNTFQSMSWRCNGRKVRNELSPILGCSQETYNLCHSLGFWSIQNDFNLWGIYIQLTPSNNTTQIY